MEAALKGLSWDERTKKLPEVYKSITDKVADKENGKAGRIYSMFKDNQYIMYVYQTFRDIRLVGTPPESVGKFGGDTDNWEWPRHTGDFSVFRVYTAADGKPAEYSKSNIPMKPKHHLPVCIKGIKDGDYAIIYGYPGVEREHQHVILIAQLAPRSLRVGWGGEQPREVYGLRARVRHVVALAQPSTRPTISSKVRKPSSAISVRTSSSRKVK